MRSTARTRRMPPRTATTSWSHSSGPRSCARWPRPRQPRPRPKRRRRTVPSPSRPSPRSAPACASPSHNAVHWGPALVAFLPALAVGSFLNVVAARLPEGRSVVSPASACPHCGAEIRSYDNIPVLSWLFLRGRCRDCGGPISWRYPALELATALLVAGCFGDFGVSWHAAAASVFCIALVVISAIDVEHRIVPNKIVLPAAVVVLALMLAWKLSI